MAKADDSVGKLLVRAFPWRRVPKSQLILALIVMFLGVALATLAVRLTADQSLIAFLAVAVLVALVGLILLVAILRASPHGAAPPEESGAVTYAGTFPSFIDKISSMIESARGDVFIACDYAGYGSGSGAKQFTKYFAALRGRRPGVRLHVIVTGAAAIGRGETGPNPDADKAFVDLRRTPKFRRHLEAIEKDMKRRELRKPDDWSRSEYLDACRKLELAHLEELGSFVDRSAGDELHVATDVPPTFLWIVDASTAIWAVPLFPPSVRFAVERDHAQHDDRHPDADSDELEFAERAFLTTDTKLVLQLKKLWQLYFDTLKHPTTPVDSPAVEREAVRTSK